MRVLVQSVARNGTAPFSNWTRTTGRLRERAQPMRRLSLVLFLLVLGMAAPAGAHESTSHLTAPSGRVTTSRNVHHDTSLPLRDIPPSHTHGQAHPALRSPS